MQVAALVLVTTPRVVLVALAVEGMALLVLEILEVQQKEPLALLILAVVVAVVPLVMTHLMTVLGCKVAPVS